VNVRRAGVDDADVLATHRANVWIEVGEWDASVLEPQIAIWAEFFRRCLADGTYVAFVAERDGHVAGSGALLLHLTIPRPGHVSDRAGRVQSVYVEPHARRQGVAHAIMDAILACARQEALVAVTLHPSDDARPLYAALGFEAADEMILRRPQ
jgi:GNAT superfamily N-acetyltransferase